MVRRLRTTKYKSKYKKIVILAQVLAIWYATVFSVSLLTTGTEAYYSSYSKINGTISTASYWWDRSELEFTETEIDVEIRVCPPIEEEISVEIKNVGSNMTGSTEYEVYFSESNSENDIKNGERVGSGNISPIENDETSNLTHLVEEEGYYMLKVYQPEGFDNNYEERTEIWSKQIRVECTPSNESNNDDSEEVQDEELNKQGEESEKPSNDTTEEEIEDSANKENETEKKDESKDDSEKDKDNSNDDSKSDENKGKSDDEDEGKDKDVDKDKKPNDDEDDDKQSGEEGEE